MKHIQTVILFSMLTASVFAQDLFNLHYQISLPMGDTKEYIEETGFRGVGLEWRKQVDGPFSAGLSFNWNVFNEVRTEVAEIDRGHVSGTQNRTINAFPMLVTGHYTFSPKSDFRPFAGMGMGAYLIEEKLGIGIYSISDSNWHFGLAPEIGFLYSIGFNTNLFVSVRYNYALEAGDAGSHSYIGLNIGFASELF